MTTTGKTLETIAKGSTGKVLTKDGKTIEAVSPFATSPVNKWVAVDGSESQWEITACEC